MANDSSSNILKNTGIITLCTLGSRITGLLRTWAMAFALGNTMLTSAYQIANNLPNMVFELAASGILATAFLPLYLLQKEKHGDEAAQRFANNMTTLTFIALGLLSLLCAIGSPLVIETQTFTVQSGETKVMAIFFFQVFAIQILFYGLGAVITGVLNAERNFLAPALAPILNNVVVIVVMFGFVPLSTMNPEFAMWWLAIGTTLGVLVQFGGQIPTLLKHGFRFRPLVDLHDPMLKEALKMALPIFVYVMGTVITTSCRNAFALDVAPNGPSTMAYARMWWQLPYGVVAVSLATTLLTELSDCAAREDWQGFREYVSKGLRSTVFLMMPLAAMVGALSIPLIQLFRAGAFTADDVQMVASVLSVWTLCLPFYAGYMYFYQVFAAMRQFVLFAAIDVGLRVVQVFMYAVVVKTDLGLLGIPFCDLVFFAAMFMICSWLVRRKVGSFGFRKVAVLLVKGGIAAVIAGALVFGASWAIESFLVIPGLPTVIYALLVCLVCGIPGLVLCFGLCKLFRMEEYEAMDGILHGIKRRLKRAE